MSAKHLASFVKFCFAFPAQVDGLAMTMITPKTKPHAVAIARIENVDDIDIGCTKVSGIFFDIIMPSLN